jgi:hypothetical protein
MACKCGSDLLSPVLVPQPLKNDGHGYDEMPVQFSRQSCPRCTFKHLAYAYVALEEVDHGYPEHIVLARMALRAAGFLPDANKAGIRALLDAKARAVGHLVHAMEECPDKNTAEMIRLAYTSILDGDTGANVFKLLERVNSLSN